MAPLKAVTIPRVELIAATMLSRTDVLWRQELHMNLQDSVFWTDSASVLKYIRNEISRLKFLLPTGSQKFSKFHSLLSGGM